MKFCEFEGGGVVAAVFRQIFLSVKVVWPTVDNKVPLQYTPLEAHLMTLNKRDEAKKQEEAIDNYCLHLGRFDIYLSKQEEAIASSCLHVATSLIVV